MKKIVLTGGPSSGKSTFINKLKSTDSQLILVPEAAMIVIGGGFPLPENEEQVKIFQRVFPPFQKQLEAMYSIQNPQSSTMVLDRATLDGYGYVTSSEDEFLRDVKLELKSELKSYDWVLFFEMPEEKHFGTNNPNRFHNFQESVTIGERQKEIWSNHPNFIVISSDADLNVKIETATKVIEMIKQGMDKSEIVASISNQ